MAAHWKIEAEDLRAKSDGFVPLLEQIGQSRFEAAVDRMIAESTMMGFPRPGELRAFVLESQERGERGWQRNPHCPKCHGTGWFYVPDPKANQLYKCSDAKAVLRCHEPGCLQLAV